MSNSTTPNPEIAANPTSVSAWWRKTSIQRRLLGGLTAACIFLLLAATGAFLLHEYQRTLREADDSAERRARRVAQDLEQALATAEKAIAHIETRLSAAPGTGPLRAPALVPADHASLLASLPIPFTLRAIGAAASGQQQGGLANAQPAAPASPPDRWTVGDALNTEQARVLPLIWPVAPNAQGITGFAVDLSLPDLLARLEREMSSEAHRVSLFRLEGDGSATLLARVPFVPTQLGTKVRADWVARAMVEREGKLSQIAALDGIPRRVAFQRLDGPADGLVVVYGAASDSLLANWMVSIPGFGGLALLLALGMGYGGWRLDRSLRAQAQSELRYRLAATTGQIWDWDLLTNELRLPSSVWNSLNRAVPPPEHAVAVFESLIAPEERDLLRDTLVRHVQLREPYQVKLRLLDDQGRGRWFESQGQAVWDSNGRAVYMAGTVIEFTERQALEQEQRQTLARLDAVANASTVMFWTSDEHGQTDWVNRSWLAFTGRTLADAQDGGWLSSVHPEDRQRCEACFLEAIRARERYSIEFRLKHASGDYRWMLEQGLPRLDADGQYIGYIGSCIDLSLLKAAEHEATQRRQLLDRLFDVLPDLFFLMEADSTILDCRGGGALYAPPEQFLGKSMLEVLPDELSSALRQKLEQAQSGALVYWEYALPTPGGERHYEARLARLTDSTQLMAVVRDITDEIRLERERERLNRFVVLLFRLASQFINLPLERLDAEIDHALSEIGAFVSADRAYIFEHHQAQGIAVNTHEWCAPGVESVQAQLQALPVTEILEWHLLQAGKPFSVEDIETLAGEPSLDMLRAQGVKSMMTLPMIVADMCVGFVGFDTVRSHRMFTQDDTQLLSLFAQMLVNVTERRTAQAKLLELTAQLEQRVEERTQQLNHSVRRLSQANRELESFAYSVSHDLKSPLRSVEGFASLLLEEQGATLNDGARNYLQRIQRATMHMARLINDLLAYCRIEELGSGLVPLRLTEEVADVLQGMRDTLDARRATVRLAIPPDLRALAHPQGLAMVLRNLLDNAMKFSRPGELPDITIEASAMGPLVRLSVRDQGMGFDMKHHDRIFAIFQRLHRPDQIAGTGIGLAMVFKAVERMDGRIWARSAPGEGATFYLDLPRA